MKFIKVLAVVLAVLMSFTGTAANADDMNAVPASSSEISVNSESLADLMSSKMEEARELDRRLPSPEELTEARWLLDRHLPEGIVADWSEAAVVSNSMVGVPLSGAGADRGSFAAIGLKGLGEKATKITLVSQKSDHSAQLEVRQNGQTTLKTLVTVNGPKPQSFDNVVQCLVGLGISLPIAAALVVACSGACAVTAGIACLACAAGFALIGGADLGYCFYKLTH